MNIYISIDLRMLVLFQNCHIINLFSLYVNLYGYILFDYVLNLIKYIL